LAARTRAIRQASFGGPEVLRLVEVERPEPIPTEVLVRAHAVWRPVLAEAERAFLEIAHQPLSGPAA
jgi:hypothetical protein